MSKKPIDCLARARGGLDGTAEGPLSRIPHLVELSDAAFRLDRHAKLLASVAGFLEGLETEVGAGDARAFASVAFDPTRRWH